MCGLAGRDKCILRLPELYTVCTNLAVAKVGTPVLTASVFSIDRTGSDEDRWWHRPASPVHRVCCEAASPTTCSRSSIIRCRVETTDRQATQLERAASRRECTVVDAQHHQVAMWDGRRRSYSSAFMFHQGQRAHAVPEIPPHGQPEGSCSEHPRQSGVVGVGLLQQRLLFLQVSSLPSARGARAVE
jgi:hypothetical protein